jgi:hypothetical protein
LGQHLLLSLGGALGLVQTGFQSAALPLPIGAGTLPFLDLLLSILQLLLQGGNLGGFSPSGGLGCSGLPQLRLEAVKVLLPLCQRP